MSGRMRRVDEAMKQVLSEAIPTLKDPRIGFVTVTAVETTSLPDASSRQMSSSAPIGFISPCGA